MSPKLAVLGGKPIREKPFPPYNTIGEEEKRAVMKVLDSGILSRFIGAWEDNFYGGDMIRKLEREWEKYFGVKYAVTVNSASSGLYAAVGALGIGPGDEVIVPPVTMCATVTAVLVYNAIPVFADIDEDIFCISPESIKKAITPRTKAIMVVHLLGQPARMDEIMKIAKEYNLKVIEDCAQVPAAMYKGKYVGTIGDIGIFSLNCYKTIQSGEGGVTVTSNDELAFRLQLIRNHGEIVIQNLKMENIVNLLGWNYRMTEIQAAIASEQLKKLDALTEPRIELANHLTEGISGIDGIIPPVVLKDCKHVYYRYALRYFEDKIGIPRDIFCKALTAEGFEHISGYGYPLYLLPIFQRKIAYGDGGCPFNCKFYNAEVSYKKAICPNVEKMYEKEIFINDFCRPPLKIRDMDDIINAFHKILENIDDLKNKL